MTRLIRAASSISAMTLLSRVLGLVRDSLMMHLLGARWPQGVFLLAWTLPNLMRRLLGEGALSASLVPAYARLRTTDEVAARRLLDDVFAAVTTILTPLCLLIAVGSMVVPAEWFPAPAEGGAEAIRLLLSLNAILFVYALPVCLTAVASGALNTLGAFALPAAVPVVLNILWIAALVVAKPLGVTTDTDIATLIAVTLTVGGFVQLLLVTVPLWRRGELGRPRFGLPRRGTPAMAVFVSMGPTLLGMSLNQISSLLDQLLAFSLISPGSSTYVYLANRLLLFPHALTAMAVGVAVFPRLASEANDEAGRERMRRTLDGAVAATLFVTLPAAAGLILLGEDVVRVLFESGEFLPEDVPPTVATTACLVAGLPALGLAQLYARAFYAVGDTSTPARTAALLVPANLLLSVTLLSTTELGTAALTLSSSVTSLANAMILARRFRRHAVPGERAHGAWLRALAATGAMSIALPFCRLGAPEASRTMRALTDVALPIVAGIAVYAIAHVLLRSPELRALRRRRAPD